MEAFVDRHFQCNDPDLLCVVLRVVTISLICFQARCRTDVGQMS